MARNVRRVGVEVGGSFLLNGENVVGVEFFDDFRLRAPFSGERRNFDRFEAPKFGRREFGGEFRPIAEGPLNVARFAKRREPNRRADSVRKANREGELERFRVKSGSFAVGAGRVKRAVRGVWGRRGDWEG